MKRKMLLLVLALPVICCQNVVAQTGSRLTGMTHLVNTGSSFTPVDSTDYVYSSNRGGDLKHTKKYDNSTVWNYLGDTAYSNSNMYLQTFDANNNLLSSTSEFWSGTAWTLLTKNLYYYNTAGYDSLMIMQSWGGSSWMPVSQEVYSYLGGKLVADQHQDWNGLTLSFTATSQKNYYYDPVSGNKINETDLDLTSGPLNTAQITYTYSGTNQMLTTTNSTWSGSAWMPNTMTTNTYDTAGNLTNVLAQNYDATTTTWVNTTLNNYSGFIGSTHNPGMDTYQTWDTAGGGTWNNVRQYSYGYNSYNQMTSSLGVSWNIIGVFEAALNDPLINYYYETYSTGSHVATNNVTAEVNSAAVYPVPAGNMLHVNLNWSEAQTATIAIYDMTGKVINQWQSDYGTQYFSAISVNNLATGTYFVKINGVNSQIVKQFVVAH